MAYEVMRDVPIAICATAAFSVNAWLMRWAGTGMETSLSVLLVLAVVLYCLRNEYFVSVFLAGLLSLVRPEACLIVPLIMGDVYINSFNKKRALKMIAALGVIYVTLLTPWLVYAWKTFGSIVPNTALSKAGFQLNLNELAATTLDLVKTVVLTDGVAIVVLIVGAMYLISPLRWNNHEKHENVFFLRQSMIGIVWIILIPVVYILTDVNVVSRYLLLVTPFITINAFAFLRRALDRFSGKTVYSMMFLLTALVMLQNQVVYGRVVRPGIDAFEKGMETCLFPIAQWLRGQTPPDAKIIIGDVGAVGYYSDRELCDAAGLISPKLLPRFRQNLAPYDIIEKKLYQDVCDVDYVIHRSPVFEQLKNDSTLFPLMTRPFSGMSLTEHRIIYYTIYKVKKPLKRYP
jgi:hypothetical protein